MYLPTAALWLGAPPRGAQEECKQGPALYAMMRGIWSSICAFASVALAMDLLDSPLDVDALFGRLMLLTASTKQ